MVYTKRGPFVNASATGPWVDADFFNNVEAALLGATGGITFAPLPTGNAATDTANMQAAISTAQAAYYDLYIIGGFNSYRLNTGITWNLTKGSIVGVGQVNLDFTAVTSGFAITLTGQNGATQSNVFPHQGIQHRISGLDLYGPDTDTGILDGIVVTDTGVGDNGSIEHCRLYGFRDGLCYQDNTWLINHTKVSVEHAHRYAVNGTQGVNAGENMHFYGCVFSGVANAAGTAACLYLPPTGADSDFFFYSCSFDYSNLAGDIEGHHVEFFGCHFEDRNNGPMFTISNTAGNSFTDVGFHGCTFASTITGNRTSALVVVPASNTSDRINVAFLGGKAGAYNQGQTLFQNLSTAAPTARLAGINVDQGAAAGGSVSQYGGIFSQLADGGFESGTQVASGLGGWALGSNADFYNALTHSGTYSLRRTLPGTSFQIAPILPKQPVSVSGYAMCNNYTSGTCTFQIQFLAADRSTVLSTVVVANITATQSWSGYQRRVIPPAGAAYASVQWTASAWSGTAELDDVQLVCL